MVKIDLINSKDELEEIVPKYYQVKQFIKSLIYSSKFRPGKQLPSEYSLAKQWNVSRLTVNKALNQLVEEGYLYRERGNGTFVCPVLKKKTKNIAVLVYHIDTPFCSQVVKGMEKKAREYGYHLILCNTLGNKKKADEIIKELILQNKVDGIICPSDNFTSSSIFKKGKDTLFPVVLFPQIEPRHRNFSYIITDDEEGTYKAIKYLIKLGHKRIGFLTPKRWAQISLLHRWKGYKRAMEESGLKVKKIVVDVKKEPLEKEWILNTEKFVKDITCLTAIFCVNDSLAIEVLTSLRKQGIKIPEDISIVGFDNIELAAHPEIQLTTVEQPTYLIGEKCVEILIKQIKGKVKSPIHIVLPTTLVIRKTTARPKKGGEKK